LRDKRCPDQGHGDSGCMSTRGKVGTCWGTGAVEDRRSTLSVRLLLSQTIVQSCLPQRNSTHSTAVYEPRCNHFCGDDCSRRILCHMLANQDPARRGHRLESMPNPAKQRISLLVRHPLSPRHGRTRVPLPSTRRRACGERIGYFGQRSCGLTPHSHRQRPAWESGAPGRLPPRLRPQVPLLLSETYPAQGAAACPDPSCGRSRCCSAWLARGGWATARWWHGACASRPAGAITGIAVGDVSIRRPRKALRRLRPQGPPGGHGVAGRNEHDSTGPA
jgi:hypothetical protein